MSLSVTPLSPALGAAISGVDLSQPLDDDTIAEIRAAWLEHVVIVLRGQALSDDHLAAFSRRIGELDRVPGWEKFHTEGHPEVLIISNVTEDGVAIGVLGDGEASWHTDMSYVAAPPTASLLYSLEIPPEGGDTCFMNMYGALEALPDDLRAAIEGRQLNHDDNYASDGRPRPGRAEITDVSQASGSHHPIIRVHPETGKPALYLGRRLNAYMVGESVADSEVLLDRIWAELLAQEATLTYRHRWQVGDVLMWDNRCAMHRRDAFDGGARRIMHRTQIK